MSSLEALTIDAFLDDNRTDKAHDRLREWEDAKRGRDLYAIWACSDSRLVLPNRAVHIYTLAAGGRRSPFNALLSDPRIKADVVVNHYDGDLAIPGESPGGCGARFAKKRMEEGMPVNGYGVEKFISEHVWHSDLVKQTNTAAAFTAYRTGRPVLAAAQDHLDLAVYPLAVYLDGGRDVQSGVPQHFILAQTYFPDEIYRDGIPVLNHTKLPSVFDDFISENLAQSSDLPRRYRDLRITQKNQNPRLLVVSTDIRPLTVRYPQITDKPGSTFRISVPQQTLDGAVRIDPTHISLAFQQAEYPVAHFSNLRTILIETRSMEKSTSVAEDLTKQEWIKSWLLNVDHQILIGEVSRGETRFIQSFQF